MEDLGLGTGHPQAGCPPSPSGMARAIQHVSVPTTRPLPPSSTSPQEAGTHRRWLIRGAVLTPWVPQDGRGR